MTDKPIYYPDWALTIIEETTIIKDEDGQIKTVSNTNVKEPSLDLLNYGFHPNKGVSRGFLNWIFRTIGIWIRYFDERCNRPEQYTNLTKPNAALKGVASQIYLSDVDTGGCIVFSDGSNWRKIKDNSIVN